MAIIALVAAVIGFITGIQKLRSTPEAVQQNTEIVIDRSESMNDIFEGASKLSAATEAASKVLQSVASSDNLALRQFGGPCDGDNTRLAVDWTQNHVKRLQQSLTGISKKGAGQASLAHAVIEATGDFNNHARFDKVAKRIVVIT